MQINFIYGYVAGIITSAVCVALVLLYRNFFAAKVKCATPQDNAGIAGVSYQDVVEQLPGNVFWKDRQGILRGGNTRHSLAFSHLTNLADITDFDLFTPEQAKKIRENDLEVMRTGQTISIEESAFNFDGRCVFYLSYKTLLRNHQGEIVGVLGSSYDVTEAKKAAADRLALLENIIALMPGYVYWVNTEGVYLGCNDNEAELLGLGSRKEIIGKNSGELFLNGSRNMAAELMDKFNQEVMISGKTILIEEPIAMLDGREATFFSQRAPVRNEEDEIIGVVGISMDISKLKQTEQELKAAKFEAERVSKIKSDFIAVVSHELRTPLTGILGLVDILQHENLTEEEKGQYLSNVNAASRYLLSLINNILDLAKLDADKYNLQYVDFDLIATIHDVIKIVSSQAEEKGLKLRLDPKPDLPRYIKGDPKSLSQVLVNIIGNAIKFTQRGGVTITITSKPIDEKHINLIIAVADTGIGIPKEKLTTIFEEFEQVDSSHTRSHSGTGLGLAVSEKLIKLMGGKILVESEMNRGTTFSLDLTFELCDASASKFLNKATEASNKQPALKCHVLLVEDDALVQMVHKHKLEAMGCTIEIANSGLSALSAYDAGKYDLIFMDIGLPDLSGNDVIRWIRKIESAIGVHTPIVALTAYSDVENHGKTIEAGADIILCKPVENDKLLAVMKEYIPAVEQEVKN